MARYSVDSCRQFGAGLLPLSCLDIQDAEATVAVGQEWAHAELVGQGEGLAVVGFGLLGLRGITMRGNVAEEPKGIRLVSTLLVMLGEVEGTQSTIERILRAAGQQIRLAQTSEPECLHRLSHGGAPAPAAAAPRQPARRGHRPTPRREATAGNKAGMCQSWQRPRPRSSTGMPRWKSPLRR